MVEGDIVMVMCWEWAFIGLAVRGCVEKNTYVILDPVHRIVTSKDRCQVFAVIRFFQNFFIVSFAVLTLGWVLTQFAHIA